MPQKTLDHTHLGSIGNLALKEIDLKQKLWDKYLKMPLILLN